MKDKKPAMRILFLDQDEASFQIWKCMANVIEKLPPVELFHASDATEALMLLENVKPDVIVLDSDLEEEHVMFMDSIAETHPPILIQVDEEGTQQQKSTDDKVFYVTKTGTLEGIHKTLLVATSMVTNDVKVIRPDLH